MQLTLILPQLFAYNHYWTANQTDICMGKVYYTANFQTNTF